MKVLYAVYSKYNNYYNDSLINFSSLSNWDNKWSSSEMIAIGFYAFMEAKGGVVEL